MGDNTHTTTSQAREGDSFHLPPQPGDLQSLDWESVDIPRYVCYHQSKLTFPEKVSTLGK
jgi:hypothetical protein